MNLLDTARMDANNIVQGEFSSPCTITNPQRTVSASLPALSTKHHITINPDTGQPVNAKNAHICLSETKLNELGYATRVNGEISLIGHFIEVPDSTGIVKKYKISESWPNETLGLIVCILQDSL